MRTAWVLLAASIFLPLAAAPAQTSAVNKQHEVQKQQVTLDVVVTRKDGHPVAGLTQTDFLLKDNGTSQAITGFGTSDESKTPSEVVLLIDAVNINFIKLADERSNIERFLKNAGRLPVPTSLAIFTDDGIKIQDGTTTDGKALSDAFDQYVTGIRTIRRSSQREEQDRFDLSMKNLDLLVKRESARPGRKAIFWVSPGWPLLPGSEIDLSAKQQNQIYRSIIAFTDEMFGARITMYSLNPLGVEEGIGRTYFYQNFLKGVTKPGQAELANLSLQVLATQSGGLALNSSNDLEGELRTCYEQTRAMYEITFEPAPDEPMDKYHHLELMVEKAGLVARTKSAYYARPEN